MERVLCVHRVEAKKKVPLLLILLMSSLPNFILTPPISLGDSKYTIFNVYTHIFQKKKPAQNRDIIICATYERSRRCPRGWVKKNIPKSNKKSENG